MKPDATIDHLRKKYSDDVVRMILDIRYMNNPEATERVWECLTKIINDFRDGKIALDFYKEGNLN